MMFLSKRNKEKLFWIMLKYLLNLKRVMNVQIVIVLGMEIGIDIMRVMNLFLGYVVIVI
jgi:hypothetical protein